MKERGKKERVSERERERERETETERERERESRRDEHKVIRLEEDIQRQSCWILVKSSNAI